MFIKGCISCLSLAVLKHDQKQLKEERVYFCLRFWRVNPSWRGWYVSRPPNWLIPFHCAAPGVRERTGSGVRPYTLQALLPPSNTLPPAKFHIPKVPQPSRTTPPAGNQEFKPMSLWGPFLFHITSAHHEPGAGDEQV